VSSRCPRTEHLCGDYFPSRAAFRKMPPADCLPEGPLDRADSGAATTKGPLSHVSSTSLSCTFQMPRWFKCQRSISTGPAISNVALRDGFKRGALGRRPLRKIIVIIIILLHNFYFKEKNILSTKNNFVFYVIVLRAFYLITYFLCKKTKENQCLLNNCNEY
jgi:hypothetical protein